MEPGGHASQVPSVPHPLLSAHAMGSRAGEGRSLCPWLLGTSPPLMVVGSGDGADSVCPLLGSSISSDGGCQGWMERAGVGWVGATFPGGLSSSLVAWFGSGEISMSAGMTTERRHAKRVLLSPAFGWASRVPPRATRDHRAWAVGASTSA